MQSPLSLLVIDTASQQLGLGVYNARTQSFHQTQLAAGRQQSDTVHTTLQHLLAQAQLPLQAVDVFVAASGPGSFTGVRLGLATAQGFAAVLNKPVVGVPLFAAWAATAALQHPAHAGAAIRTVWLEAHNNEVYCQNFSRHNQPLAPATVLPVAQAAEQLASHAALKTQVVLCGDCLLKFAPYIPAQVVAETSVSAVSLQILAQLGAQTAALSAQMQQQSLQPVYLRPLHYQKQTTPPKTTGAL